MPLGVVRKTFPVANTPEPLSLTPLFVASLCVQTQGAGPSATANAGKVWISSSAAVSNTGTTGIYLEAAGQNLATNTWSFPDPCGRNSIDLRDIWMCAGVAGDAVIAIYHQSSNLSDRDLLTEMQYHLVEGPANGDQPDGLVLTTPTWTLTNWINELDSAYKALVGTARLFNYIGTQAVTSGTSEYSLDGFFADTVCGANLVDVIRMSFVDTSGVSYGLQPTDAWVYDHASAISTKPQGFSLVTQGTRTVKLYPTPTENGTLHCIFTGFGLDLTGAGTQFSLPDEIVPFVKWGALASLLAYDGQGNDPARAAYCTSRWEDGIEAARILTGDFYV